MKRLLLLLGALAGCTGAPPPSGALEQPIINGFLDPTDTSVVLLQANGAALCTAEIISPHVALTAGHCSLEPAGSAYAIEVVDDVTGSIMNIPVTEMHADPQFDVNAVDSGHDLAVALLADAAPVAPLSYNRLPIPASWKTLRRGARLVGFGLASPSDPQSYGRRRQTGSTVVNVRDGILAFRNGFSGTCFGDSGGPALMRVGGAEAIVSVTSYGYGNQINGCDFNQGDVESRVDSDHAFVDGWVDMLDPPAKQGAVGEVCATNRDCASGVCGSVDDDQHRFCTATCDPTAATSACPASMPCSLVDDIPLCMPSGPGCALGGAAAAPPSSALLLVVAVGLAALAARRRLRLRS